MRAFSGKTWEDSPVRGESNLIDLNLGGGTTAPPYLFGLQSFAVYPVPEPSVVQIALAAGLMLIVALKASGTGPSPRDRGPIYEL